MALVYYGCERSCVFDPILFSFSMFKMSQFFPTKYVNDNYHGHSLLPQVHSLALLIEVLMKKQIKKLFKIQVEGRK